MDQAWADRMDRIDQIGEQVNNFDQVKKGVWNSIQH